MTRSRRRAVDRRAASPRVAGRRARRHRRRRSPPRWRPRAWPSRPVTFPSPSRNGEDPVHLHDLLDAVDVLELTGDPQVEVSDIGYDSRRATRGSLFCCIRGATVDGHDHAAAAVERGAVALLVERPVEVPVTQARVEHVRSAMGPVAARLHGDPSRSMRVLGITGTNGKTTTTFILEAIARAAGVPSRDHRHDRRSDRRCARSSRADHARGAAAAGAARPHARLGSRHGCDGGELARAGLRARRRHPLRGHLLHEPLPGPPRSARDVRGLLRGEGALVHATVHRHRGDRARRPVGARARHREPKARVSQ